MKEINVSEATNNQLDWLVAKASGGEGAILKHLFHYRPDFHPTTNPALMWPIIEREKISMGWGRGVWSAATPHQAFCIADSTALIAAARCYVLSRLGEIAEVPEELT